jgi:glutamate/tyrosine decarboxylase-like PLP-dependent enzyme
MNFGESHGAEFDALFKAVVPLLSEYVHESQQDSSKVVNYSTASDLRKKITLDEQEQGANLNDMVDAVKMALQYSVRTSHPLFMDKLYCGSEPVGQVAELVVSILNTNVHTFAVAPLFAAMEVELMSLFGRLIGWGGDGDGIMVPGGSYGNLMGLLLARNKRFPDIRTKGFFAGAPARRPVVLTSTQAHYSAQKNASIGGIGIENVVTVPCHYSGSIDPDELQATITRLKAEGADPFFLQATAGTTVLGAYDPIPALAEICKKENVWLHVDGSWGGSALLSRTEANRGLLNGLEKVDSFVFNPHKMLGVPTTCSLLLIPPRYETHLRATTSVQADYLFHRHENAAYDLGAKTFQCGRKADSFKLWMTVRRHGVAGLGARVDGGFHHARELTARLARAKDSQGRSAFWMVSDATCANVCFFAVPASMRDVLPGAIAGVAAQAQAALGSEMDDDAGNALQPRAARMGAACKHSAGWIAAPLGGPGGILARLDDATQKVYAVMQEQGKMLINFSPLTDLGLPRFFRAIVTAPSLSEARLDEIVETYMAITEKM